MDGPVQCDCVNSRNEAKGKTFCLLQLRHGPGCVCAKRGVKFPLHTTASNMHFRVKLIVAAVSFRKDRVHVNAITAQQGLGI